MMSDQNTQTSSTVLAIRSKQGKLALGMSFGGIVLVLVMMYLKNIFNFGSFLVMLPGIISMAGTYMFANVANEIRMEQERQNHQKGPDVSENQPALEHR